MTWLPALTGRSTMLTPGRHALDRLVEDYGDAVSAKWPLSADAAIALDETAELLCAEARAIDAHRAEQLVISLHEIWSTLPAVRRLAPGKTSDDILARVVTECIRHFYDGARPADLRLVK